MTFRKIPVIVGPTGVGKTEVAFHLAQKLHAEIISADAFQIYDHLPVGTAQPPPEYLKTVPHHLIGVRDPVMPWNAVLFAEEARRIIDRMAACNKRVVIVGGSGFYIQALVDGVPEGGPSTIEEREWVLAEVLRKGGAASHDWLKKMDPAAATRLHVNDTKRICRALEIVLYPKPPKASSVPLGSRCVQVIGLERKREELDGILKKRTLKIWESGLLNETKWLLDSKVPETANVWGAIGYREAASYLKGLINHNQALELIYRRTRQYAKRQWTWFKHHHGTVWYPIMELNLDSIVNKLE